MKVRTYECYEIRRDLGKDSETVVSRTPEFDHARVLLKKAYVYTKPGEAVYLCRVTTIEKMEREDD